MKLLKSSILALILYTSLVACSKKSDDDAAPAPNSLQGEWHGEAVTDATKVNSFYAFNFKAGGVLDRVDEKGDVVGTGTWKIENTLLDGYYKNTGGTKISLIGSYNSSVKKILGNWGYGSSVTNGGTYELKRKQ